MARYPNGVNYKFKTPKHPESDKLAFALLRCTQGFSTTEIFMNAGYIRSRSTIDKIRRRQTRYPRFMTVVGIVHACGLKMADLLNEIEESYPTPKKTKKPVLKDKKSSIQKTISEAVYAV